MFGQQSLKLLTNPPKLSPTFVRLSLRVVARMLNVIAGGNMTFESNCCDSLEGSRRLRNEELIARLRRLAHDDRKLTARLLVHLGEVDARGLFRDEAFTSMYAFMVEGLGMSEGEAGLRLCAARVVRRFPRVLDLFAAQELHLSAIKLLSTVLSEDNHESLLAAARGQTKAEIELLLAKQFPKPDVADSIRKLPSCRTANSRSAPQLVSAHASHLELRLDHRTSGTEGPIDAMIPNEADTRSPDHAHALRLVPACDEPSAVEAKQERCKDASKADTSTIAASAGLAAGDASGQFEVSATRGRTQVLGALNRQRWSQPLSEGRFMIRFTADAVLEAKLKQAQALSRHPIRKDDIATVIDEALTLLITKRQAERFGIGTQRSSTRAPDRGPRVESSKRRNAQDGSERSPATSSVDQRTAPRSNDSGSATGGGATCASKALFEPELLPARCPPEQRAAARGAKSEATAQYGREPRHVRVPSDGARADRSSRSAAAAVLPHGALVSSAEPHAPKFPPAEVLARTTAPRVQSSATKRSGPISPPASKSNIRRSHYVPVAVRREVARRDGMRCAFVAADGRRCQETHALELDHRHPRARGGSASEGNLRLLCRVHNVLAAERDFGRDFVRARIDERRAGSAPGGIAVRPKQSAIPES